MLSELGAHPATGAMVRVKTGRYGPYVTDGNINATLPKGSDPEAITLERAIELLEARAEKLRSQGKDPTAPKKRRRATRKKTTRKK